MEGERRVLQDRIEAIALDGRRIEPHEGIGGQHDEEQEGETRPSPAPQGRAT